MYMYNHAKAFFCDFLSISFFFIFLKKQNNPQISARRWTRSQGTEEDPQMQSHLKRSQLLIHWAHASVSPRATGALQRTMLRRSVYYETLCSWTIEGAVKPQPGQHHLQFSFIAISNLLSCENTLTEMSWVTMQSLRLRASVLRIVFITFAIKWCYVPYSYFLPEILFLRHLGPNSQMWIKSNQLFEFNPWTKISRIDCVHKLRSNNDCVQEQHRLF